MVFCLFKGDFGKLANWSSTPMQYGSFNLLGPSGEFGTSGPMGVAHGNQKFLQKLIAINRSFDQIHSSATPPPLPLTE